MINYIIPGLYEHFNLNKAFIASLKNHPKHQLVATKINAGFGNFQFCIWDGGRIFDEYKQTTIEEIDKIFSYYTNENIVSRLIFTNNQLKEEDYYDRFCNLILTIGQDYNVEIVVADDNLREYIQNKYPNYKMVCLDYNLNHNKKLLNFSLEEKEKTEFLCNAICPPACPYRKEHYKLNSFFSLTYGIPDNTQNCSIKYNTVEFEQINSSNYITLEQIQNYYYPNGFKYFTLEGSTLSPLEVLCNYANYFIKSEYRQSFLVKFNSFYFRG